MVDKTSRALRRHHRARMHKRALKLQKAWWNWPEEEGGLLVGGVKSEETLHRGASRLRDNMKICSCWMCCNPRRSSMFKKRERLTMQEHRENDRFEDQLKELDFPDEPVENGEKFLDGESPCGNDL